ncbi:MAG: hypothetical protein DI598_12210 [Pseudopedobacter saltans]|uniref:Glycosyl transferase n=1 Tax=Pseudopedobacter saltans TaxID=151895 RepID=A0A2W5EYC8_9SPHI|nr:MAG: hypothetical protein DI598_12210 [Pseudopedobacter saltans]
MISNIFHFIFGLEKNFGNKPFSIFHYLAIKSAYDVNKPDNIFLHYKYEPTGEWWDKTKRFVTFIPVDVPLEIFGNKLYHYAHKADVIRLLILRKYGGIYLDLDTICIRSLSKLFDNPFVMGMEKINGMTKGLCNAVILSTPNSLFIQHWLNSYRFFRSKGFDNYWGEHSVRVPLFIADQYPETIHIEENESFFCPSYSIEDLDNLFNKNKIYSNAYIFHLWESISYEKYLIDLDVKSIEKIDTTYNIVARRYL